MSSAAGAKAVGDDANCPAARPQLRRALITYDVTEPAAPDQDTKPPTVPDLLSVAAQPADLSMYFDHDRFHLTYSAPADIGALVHQALLKATDALFLATQGTAGKFRIYLHLDTTGQGWLTKRGALPPHLPRTWTCDRDTSDPPTKSCTWTGFASTADHLRTLQIPAGIQTRLTPPD